MGMPCPVKIQMQREDVIFLIGQRIMGTRFIASVD